MNLTIVLLTPSATPILPVLANLSATGAFGELLTVDEGLDCEVLRDGTFTAVSLDHHLADRRLDLVRLVRMSFAGEPIHSAHHELVDRLSGSLPRVGATVEKGSIVVPLEGGRIDARAFEPYWNYGFLVEPTDGLGERGFPTLPLLDEERRAVVAANVLGVCGGLWTWLETTPIDHGAFRLEGDGGSNSAYDGGIDGARIRVIRATTRIIDLADLSRQIVDRAFAPGVRLPPPTGCVRHPDQRAFVAGVASTLVPIDASSPLGFAFRPATEPAAASPVEVGVIQAIRRFGAEVGGELRRMPSEAVTERLERLRRRVETAVENRTFGADADLVVRFGTPLRPELALDPTRRSEEVAALASISPTQPAPSPDTWVRLVNTTLALADGSDLPAGLGLEPVRAGGLRAIADPDQLADPTLATLDGGRFILTEDDARSIGWDEDVVWSIPGCDPIGVRGILSTIEAAEGSAAAAVETESIESSSPDGDLSVEPPESSEVPQTETEGSRARRALRTRLAKWRDERASTLVWRLAERLMHEQDRSLGALSSSSAELEQILEELEQSVETERRSRRRFRRWALVAVLGLIAGLAMPAVALTLGWIIPVLWLAIGAVAVFSSLWAMVRSAMRRVRDRHRLSVLEKAPDALAARRQNAADEYARLSTLYRVLQDWAQITAVALHRPLGSVQQDPKPRVEPRDGALSLVWGDPVLDDQAMAAVSLRIAQQVATPGWMSRAFDRHRAIVMDDYQTLAGALAAASIEPESDDSDGDDPIATLPADGTGGEVVVRPPRAHLLHLTKWGTFASQVRDEQIDAHGATVTPTDAKAMVRTIGCEPIGLTDPRRGTQEFLAPIVELDQVPDFRGVFRDALQLAGLGTTSIAGLADGVTAQIPTGRQFVEVHRADDRLLLAAFRLDVSHAVDVDDVALVETDSGPREVSADSQDDDHAPLLG